MRHKHFHALVFTSLVMVMGYLQLSLVVQPSQVRQARKPQQSDITYTNCNCKIKNTHPSHRPYHRSNRSVLYFSDITAVLSQATATYRAVAAVGWRHRHPMVLTWAARKAAVKCTSTAPRLPRPIPGRMQPPCRPVCISPHAKDACQVSSLPKMARDQSTW